MSDKYILIGKKAIRTTGIFGWAEWLETADRRVAEDSIGSVRISTVFLGLDRGFGMGKPQIFETMVFGGPLDQEQVRYATWEEAERGHLRMVHKVRQSQ